MNTSFIGLGTRLATAALVTVALVLSLATAAIAEGRAELTLTQKGVVTGGGITVTFSCTAEGEGDGSSYPDPHKVRVACALENSAGRRWAAPPVESHVVPLAVTTAAAVIPFADLPGLRLCGLAEADFSDGSTARDSHCSATNVSAVTETG